MRPKRKSEIKVKPRSSQKPFKGQGWEVAGRENWFSADEGSLIYAPSKSMVFAHLVPLVCLVLLAHSLTVFGY